MLGDQKKDSSRGGAERFWNHMVWDGWDWHWADIDGDCLERSSLIIKGHVVKDDDDDDVIGRFRSI